MSGQTWYSGRGNMAGNNIMPKTKKPEYVDLTPKQADELIARISNHKLSDQDLQLIKTIVTNYLWVVSKLREGALKSGHPTA